MEESNHEYFMRRAIALARLALNGDNGGPFGAVVVKDGVIVGEGKNDVTVQNDPTAHAEIVAIRNACRNLDQYQLEGCVIYSSCEPCPMCLGAIYWARPDKIFYAASKADASDADFDDAFIYAEMEKTPVERNIPSEQLLKEEAQEIFQIWKLKHDKKGY